MSPIVDPSACACTAHLHTDRRQNAKQYGGPHAFKSPGSRTVEILAVERLQCPSSSTGAVNLWT